MAPKITITCDCGEARKVEYGERYTCTCGRHWSTTGIPAEDYERIRYIDRRFRIVGWVGFGLLGALLLVVSVINPGQLLIATPGLMLVWFTGLRPIVRRRHWRAVQSLTRNWKLKPEPDA